VKDNFVTVLFLAGVAAVFIKWSRLWRFLRFPDSSNWPTMPATVEQVVVQPYSDQYGTTYRVEVVYSYHVSGEYYPGRCEIGNSVSKAEADGIISQYPKETTVQIHVHPAKPELSILVL
jgi:hypothetical protein